MKKFAYLSWFATAVFYYYQYILRVSPSVMVTELRQAFHMTAEAFSSLGAWYLYAYALLQIPIGILIDQIGVRKTVLGSIVLCMMGTVAMAESEALWMIQLSRALIGAGSACAFMSALKVAADWLPPGKRGLFMGMTLTLGTIGALTAGRPLVGVLESVGWRNTLLGIAAVGIGLFLFTYVVLRLPHQDKKVRPTMPVLRREILQILRNQPVMIYALLAIGVYTPLAVLADLWGTAFLMEKYTLTRADAAPLSTLMYVGLSVGSLVLPWACEKWGILNRAIQICGLGVFLCFGLLLWGPSNMGIGSLSALLLLLGVFCGAEMICFTGASHFTTQENSGITLGVVNTLNMLGGAMLQQLIGFCLDLQWKGAMDEMGVRVYHTLEFQLALSCLLGVIGACCLISLRLRQE